ncbi:hypothetical protein Y695_01959 [Hydrogenophaga sp. T4]|nr:hypothetical protein Y695_01959 [Hydrogenophaga sp. T4]
MRHQRRVAAHLRHHRRQVAGHAFQQTGQIGQLVVPPYLHAGLQVAGGCLLHHGQHIAKIDHEAAVERQQQEEQQAQTEQRRTHRDLALPLQGAGALFQQRIQPLQHRCLVRADRRNGLRARIEIGLAADGTGRVERLARGLHKGLCRSQCGLPLQIVLIVAGCEAHGKTDVLRFGGEHVELQAQATHRFGLWFGQAELPRPQAAQASNGFAPANGARDHHVHEEIGGRLRIEQQLGPLTRGVNQPPQLAHHGGVLGERIDRVTTFDRWQLLDARLQVLPFAFKPHPGQLVHQRPCSGQ